MALMRAMRSFFLMTLFGAAAGAQPAPGEQSGSVGLIVAASGYASSLGTECRNGMEAARKSFPFAGIDFVYGDSKSEGPAAVNEFKKMCAADRAIAVVTHQSQPTMQINPLSAAQRLPLLGVIAQDAFVAANPCAFRFWPSAEAEAEALRPALEALNVKRLALVTAEDEYPLSIRERLLRLLPDVGAAAVFDERVLKTEADFRSILARLKAAQADGIFVNAAIAQLAPLVRQIRGLGLEQRIIGNGWFMTEEVEAMLGAGFLEGVVFARIDPDKPGFTERLREAAPQARPTPVTYACFAAMAALQQGLAAAAPPADSAALLAALQRLDHVTLPDETLPLVGRELRFNLTLKLIRRGKITAFDGR